MRFGSVGTQYFSDNGDPLSGGLLYFYETGTTTAKATYSDDAETIANTNPVVLDASGRQPDIFFSGLAKVTIKDSDGVLIDSADPIGAAAVQGSFSTWVVTVEYGAGDTVTDANGNYYVSIVSANLGNNPTVSPAYWQQMLYTYLYNANFSYELGDVVTSGTVQYISLQGTNAGHTPATSPNYWQPLNTDSWVDMTVKTADFTAVRGRHYLLNTIGGSFTMTLPSSPASGDTVGFTDYGGQFGTNNLTVGRNTQSIMNSAADLTADISYFSGTLIFTIGRGWVFK